MNRHSLSFGGGATAPPRERAPRLSNAEIRAALRLRYKAPEYAYFEEVASTTGFTDGERKIDALAQSLWPSRGLDLLGFEIKTSRSDWLREKVDPAKAEAFAAYCDRFYLVIGAADVLAPGELPSPWGLLVPKAAGGLSIHTEAPVLTPKAMTRRLLASILRRSCEASVDKLTLDKAVGEAVARERKAQAEVRDLAVKRVESELETLRRNVQAFEEASGIKLHPYQGGRIGEKMREFLNGGLEEWQREYTSIWNRVRRMYEAMNNE